MTVNRREAVRQLLAERGDLVVVAGLGAPAYDVAAVGDTPLDFPLWGAMGGAAMMGLGLAIAQPERTVLVVTGDGEMLMGMGSLATIAAQSPPNLCIAVLDNERFGETGNQPTHTAWGTDLAGIAKACGIAETRTILEINEVDLLRIALHGAREGGGGPLFAVIKIAPDPEPRVLPPRDGPFLARRLRTALLGAGAATGG